MNQPSYSSLDEALEVLAAYGPDRSNGLTSHAPMAVEALCAMGRPEAVRPWLATYDQLLPRPGAVEPIRRDHWREALAQPRRFGDWSELFAHELQEAAWREVLDRWVDRLAPGVCASATHGVIRVGHAARGLADSETPRRRQELADALASWAAEYQELPTDTSATVTGLDARRAIARVAVVPPAQRRFTGTIVSSLEGLSEFPQFAPAIGLLDVSGEPAAVAAQMAEVFARVYLANAHDFLSVIVFIHGVTSVAALANIAPHVRTETARRALRYAWQAGCGLYAAFGDKPEPDADVEAPREDADTLVDMAIACGDEHAIKFTEACLSRHASHPSPVYLAAARHAIGALG